jgi:histidinol dehydrogenase
MRKKTIPFYEKKNMKKNLLGKLETLFQKRSWNKDSTLADQVRTILTQVSQRGLPACLEYTEKFDHVCLVKKSVLLSPPYFSGQWQDRDFEKAIREAIRNIRAYHQKQKPRGFSITTKGAWSEERWIPLDRVGCYVPGGSAPLISTVLMTVIPAKLAGVKSVVVCTPPGKDGKVNPYILKVCDLLRVDHLLNLGGAQGIGALAFGFQGFPRVDKIVGPGNRFVTEAKRQVFGVVDIDMLAGPSEICILADETANVSYIAADILSQIEHDPEAIGVVISPSQKILDAIPMELEKQKQDLSRKSIIESALKNVKMISVDSLTEGIRCVDALAPEHLELMVKNPKKVAKHPFKAGAVFLGNFTPVAVGDFFGGTNHVLPTSGRAVFSSPLSVYDFYRRSSYLEYSRKKMNQVGALIKILANREQLPAHEESVAFRMRHLIP